MVEEKNPIQVAERLFHVIETLAEHGPMGLIELSKLVELNKSTVHRLLNSLIFMGYVKQENESNKYSLSFKFVDISNKILKHVDIIDIVRPYLKRLAASTGETVHFVQRDGNEAVYIDKVESNQNSIQMVSRVGSRIPMYCSGVGKAIAATMNDQEIKNIWDSSKIIKKTSHTIVSYEEFLRVIEEIKLRGYALDNEEHEDGVRCIAASLEDTPGEPQYAFSISAPIQRMSDERVKELSKYVLDMKDQLRKEFM